MSRGFRLAVVLRLRELAEEAAQTELAVALRGHRLALDDHREAIQAEALERDRADTILRTSGLGGAVAAGELADALAAIEIAQAAIDASQGRVIAAADVLLDTRGRLAEATSQRKVVERLRDRAAGAERLRVQRREDAVLNEVASTRYAWAALDEVSQ